MKIILFSGAHGVGKGFFLNKVKENVQQYDILSASTLIEIIPTVDGCWI